MNNPSLENVIEAALFYKGGSMGVKELCTITQESAENVNIALGNLSRNLESRGIRLLCERDSIALATSPETQTLIDAMRKEELDGPLGKAGLETLSVIIYRGPVSRADIEYVRGVNCTAILRSLLIRGLIERVEHPEDKRSYLYQSTTELPAYLGVSSLVLLPDYDDTRSKIEELYAIRDRMSESSSNPDTSSL